MGQVVPVVAPARHRFNRALAESTLNGEPVAQGRFFRLCRALARRAGARFFVRDHTDDMAQDLALFCLSDALPRFVAGDIDEDAYFLAMLNMSRTIAQRYQRAEIAERRRAASVGPDGLDGDGHEEHRLPDVLRDDATPETIVEADEEAQAQARALAEIKARMRATPTQVVLPSARAPKQPAPQDEPEGAEGDAALDTSAARLPPPTLADLLDVLGLPLAQAQAMLALPSLTEQEAAAFDARSWAYRTIRLECGVPVTKTAKEWIEGWGQRLGFEAGDYRGLAAFFGLHYSTLHRWYSGGVTPGIGRLANIGQMARTSHLWSARP